MSQLNKFRQLSASERIQRTRAAAQGRRTLLELWAQLDEDDVPDAYDLPAACERAAQLLFG
jgi:hypothetical protein